MRQPSLLPWLWIPALTLLGCGAGEEGLRLTPPGSGPLVVFDLDAQPLPEIPFPNDLATRPDPSAATGRRVNASQVAPTSLESQERSRIDRLDGFGLSQPITVRFDSPLDLDNLIARHQGNLDFADDAVYLVDIDPKSPGFGTPVLLDMGRGNFPATLQSSDEYFPSDPRGGVANLLFDTVEEDQNGNGILDPGEDTDDDGVLDHPNVWPPGSDPFDHLLTFYESETNTLILRPVAPLRQGTTYAVILSDRLLGRNGAPVRSPFRYVHHLDQTPELSRLSQVFERWHGIGINLSLDGVAFAWTFTTQAATADLVAIREGLHGFGPLSWMAAQFPDDVTPERGKNQYQDPPYYLVESGKLIEALRAVGPALLQGDISQAEPLLDTYQFVDYLVTGSFVSPDFLSNPEETFRVDLSRGTAEVKENHLFFTMAIPKENESHHPPFPVVIYNHGYSSARPEFLGFAGTMARYGLATVAIDAWGHGLALDPQIMDLIVSAAQGWGFEPFMKDLLAGRARDLDGDGVVDSGGDFWTAYGCHTRDAVRQTVADLLQLTRVLHSFDGKRTWHLDQNGDGRDDLAGDFNGDGKVDAGGPDVPYFAWGQSMGAIHTAVLGPLEPSIVAIAPTSGGGGLADVGLRTMLGNVRRAVMLRTMGPLVLGIPAKDGALQVELEAALANESRELIIAEVPDLVPGDQVIVTNLTKGAVHRAHVWPGPRFRVSMAADYGDRFQVKFLDPAGVEIASLDTWSQDVFYQKTQEPTYRAGEPLQSPTDGYGLARCTPDLRRLVGLFQMILEPADPSAYAPHYFQDPLPIRPEGPTVTNILEVATLGDQSVPINTQASLGRAAGLIPYLEVDPRYGKTANDWLIGNYVYEGLAYRGRFPGSDAVFDPDDLDEGRDGFNAPGPGPGGPLRLKVQTATGLSGIRFAYMDPGGQHGIFIPSPQKAFDMDTYFANLIGRFFATRGTEILDDVCLEDNSCPAP